LRNAIAIFETDPAGDKPASRLWKCTGWQGVEDYPGFPFVISGQQNGGSRRLGDPIRAIPWWPN